MNNAKKGLYIAGLVLLLTAAILAWKFSTDIRLWLAGVFVDILILAAVFCAGWLLGRFGGKRSRSREQESARNITEAQKR